MTLRRLRGFEDGFATLDGFNLWQFLLKFEGLDFYNLHLPTGPAPHLTSFRKYQRYFNSLGTLLFQERYDLLARYYALPLEANLAGNWFTIQNNDEMVMHLRRHHVALLNRGTTAILPQVVAVELSSPQPRIWVRWSEVNPSLPQGRVANVMYNMTDRGAAPQVSRLNYTSLMMPEFSKASINKRLMPRI